MPGISRRFFVSGLIAGVAAPALAEAPLRSLRPVPRPAVLRGAAGRGFAGPAPRALVEAARLGGNTAVALADLETGEMIESLGATEALPPASTAKAITALYALEALGPGHRFATRIIATAPPVDGVIQGDLVLAGGGDPTLTTDELADLAAAVRAQGITGITGRFLCWGGALPAIAQIDGTQPEHVGYNPSVSGLNLNYNRLYFGWKRSGSGYQIAVDARGRRHAPLVAMARVTLADRAAPIFDHRIRAGIEEWSVARPALGAEGGRWLPVRQPEFYAADVFRTLARAQGLTLPEPEISNRVPAGAVVAATESAPLATILTGMLKHSTNITAEAVGMAATVRLAPIQRHAQSGRAMSGWMTERIGGGRPRFVDHSGLGGASRVTPQEMIAALVLLGPGAGLADIMKPVKLRDGQGRALKTGAGDIRAKTGTLNFVSTLAGYVTGPGGRPMAFAILSGDVARRDALPLEQRERPPGGRAWLGRARGLQNALLARWAGVRV